MSGFTIEAHRLLKKIDSSSSYSDWIRGRRTAHLSTNSQADNIAFQNWRRFKEAYAPELVDRAVRETSKALQRPVATCLDPFGGSGTTALSCQFLGILPLTVEVNPFLADLIEAKLSTYNLSELADGIRKITNKRSVSKKTALRIFRNAPPTFIQPGKHGKYIFSHSVAQRIATLLQRIERIPSLKSRRLFRVMLASIAVDVSNVVVSGKGRRYRHNWKSRRYKSADVDKAFTAAVLNAVYDISKFADRPTLKYYLLRGDARKLLRKAPQTDLAIFSPPYPNSFDYTDVYNVELWAGGYLTTAADNRRLRMKTLRSHVQIKRSFEYNETENTTLNNTIQKLDNAKPLLWNRNIPSMIGAYFEDLRLVMAMIANRLAEMGRAYIVVGNSRYAGIEIDVARILTEICQSLGLTLVYSEPFRSMRSSPQQGGQADLLETLVVFSKS